VKVTAAAKHPTHYCTSNPAYCYSTNSSKKKWNISETDANIVKMPTPNSEQNKQQKKTRRISEASSTKNVFVES
jgi:hypothetical protein